MLFDGSMLMVLVYSLKVKSLLCTRLVDGFCLIVSVELLQMLLLEIVQFYSDFAENSTTSHHLHYMYVLSLRPW